MILLEGLHRSDRPAQHVAGAFRCVVSEFLQPALHPVHRFVPGVIGQPAPDFRHGVPVVFRFGSVHRRVIVGIRGLVVLQGFLQFLVRRQVFPDGNHRARAHVVVDPFGVRNGQPHAAVAGPAAEHLIALDLHGFQADLGVNRRMERNLGINPRPVAGIVAPFREIAPFCLPPVQHPVSHRAGRAHLAGGAQHLAHGNGIVAVLVPGVDGNDLVLHVHGDGEGHRFRRGRRLRRCVRHHNPRIVEDQVPRRVVHLAGHRHAVLFLNLLHGFGGLVLIVP